MSNFSVTPYSRTVETIRNPLANSTPMHMDMSTNSTCYIYNNISYNEITINEVKEPTKSSKTKKKVGSKKAITAKKTTTNAIKPAGNNTKTGVKTVERILTQINMVKYTHLFKNYDVDRFKALRELDLNAMGITRPQELRIFKDAIYKAKCDM